MVGLKRKENLPCTHISIPERFVPTGGLCTMTAHHGLMSLYAGIVLILATPGVGDAKLEPSHPVSLKTQPLPCDEPEIRTISMESNAKEGAKVDRPSEPKDIDPARVSPRIRRGEAREADTLEDFWKYY